MLVVGLKLTRCVKSVQIYGVFSGPYFAAFGLNIERFGVSLHSVRMRENTDQKKLRIRTLFVSLRIQSECEKIQTRKNSVSGHFSRSDYYNSHKARAHSRWQSTDS